MPRLLVFASSSMILKRNLAMMQIWSEMLAMLNSLLVCVACAYSTIGRGPEQVGAAPVGTIKAPEDKVAEPVSSTVQNFR